MAERPMRMTEAEFTAHLNESFDNGARATIDAVRSMLDGLEERLNLRATAPAPIADETNPQEERDERD